MHTNQPCTKSKLQQISKQKITYINLYMQADKTKEDVRQTKT